MAFHRVRNEERESKVYLREAECEALARTIAVGAEAPHQSLQGVIEVLRGRLLALLLGLQGLYELRGGLHARRHIEVAQRAEQFQNTAISLRHFTFNSLLRDST